MKKLALLLLLILVVSINAQEWKRFYNKIPAWPSEITASSVENFNTALQKLKSDINGGQPDYTAQYSNMTTEESSKMAEDMEKNAQKILAAALAGNSQLIDVTTEEVLPEETELYVKMDAVKYDYDNKLYDDAIGLRDKYNFNPDNGDTKCGPLSKDLVKVADRYAKEYFTGSNARLRKTTDKVIDYIIKVKLPAEVKKDKDKHKLMEIDVSGDQAALLMVKRCIDLLLDMGDRMNWIVRLKGKDNVIYEPGQSW